LRRFVAIFFRYSVDRYTYTQTDRQTHTSHWVEFLPFRVVKYSITYLSRRVL